MLWRCAVPVTKVEILKALSNKLRAKNDLRIAWSLVQQARQELENTQAVPGHPADIAYAQAAIDAAIAEKDLARTAYQNTALIYTALVQQREIEKEVRADVDQA